MKLEDLARHAARQTRNAAQEMPVVPITDIRRQRRTVGALIPILGVAATWIIIAVLTPPPSATPPVATNPTASTIGNTQTTTATPNSFESVIITQDDVSAFEQLTDIVIPLGTNDGCCIGSDIVGDEKFMFGSDRVSKFTDRAEPLFTWEAFEAKAFIAVSSEVTIAGLDGSGSSELRRYSRDGTLVWDLAIGFELDERSQLAIDKDKRIWLGTNDLLPAGSGFARTQWILVAAGDGTPIPEQQRSEARPLPDGRSIQLSDHSVTLTSVGGEGIRWELPNDLTVVSADPFLDGLLVTATNDPTAELGQTVALSLQPGAVVTGFWLDRYWGDIAPGPKNTVVDNGALYGLGRNNEGLFLSITQLETLHPLPPFSLSGVQWTGSDHQTIRTQTGSVVTRGHYLLPGRAAAWDGDGGMVTLGETGLSWVRSEGTSEWPAPSEPLAEIVEVVKVDDGHVVGARLLHSYNTISWFRLETGELTEPPATARTLDGVTFSAAGRTATITLPDWSNVQQGEGGEPIPPFDLPELVISGADGTELLRVTVGTIDRPYVQIHDFDGRRMILSASPQEPASPPQTVWIIDLECSECTRDFNTPGPFWFDLIGIREITGGVVQPILDSEPTQLWPSP